MKTKETSTKQIYITVVTSGLTMLANKVARVLQPDETEFDACSELANEIAKENKLDWSNVLVQYFNHYSDTYPAIPFKVPNKPKIICNHCGKPKNGVETGLCNHCGRFGKTTRERALTLHKNEVVDKSYPKEFQNVYLKPNQKQYSQEEVDRLLDQQAAKTAAQVLKSNQKQFKQFDESLFKAYIDKLPESESLNMIKIIYENKLPDCKFKAYLDKWFKL